MRIVCLIIFLFPFTLFVQAQSIGGEITSSADGLAVEGVHIVNTTANKMAISDAEGHFDLIANKGDTLVASNINFNTKQFIVKNEQFLKITLNPAIIQLDEVRVSNMPENEAEFRKKIISMGEVEDDSFVPFGMKPNKPKGNVPKNYDPNYTNSVGYAINKPISFIVKKLSKNHKNKLKYYQTVANKGNVIANNKKYSPEIVKELTGLEGDDLTDFIQYLDLDPAFVKRSSEYEIATRILKEYDYYKSKSQKG
ncbi:carboxypeptidase-like regulatory domain-containing protein [Marivirga tractuosa]|uniref:carboxypeptidase-like regulatory domain-containing protein n=1 Tax=Marivirga tractuosa TaxID=1006 RepID=UPI0035CF1B39